MRRYLTAGVLASLSLTGFAIAQETSTEPATEAAPAQAAEQAVDPSTVLATVDGTEITLGHAIATRDSLPPQYQQLPDDVLMKGIVDQLVDQTLLAQQVSKSPETDPLEVRLLLENERRSALAGRVIQERVGAPLEDAEVQAAYDAQLGSFQPQKEFKASHILVETEQEAKDLRARIEAGEDFAELAKANSTDPGSGAQGGALGWFGAGQMVPEFDAAVATLEPGAVSQPVQTQFGWHVVRLEETRDTAPPTLAEVRPELENALRQQKLAAELDALRAEAAVERSEAAVPAAAIRQSDVVRN
jgi:peptidyl-prolyl cis-trans isomerase C